MLLSMFISFILARRFTGKTYVSLMAVSLALVSLFSMGLPSRFDYYPYSDAYKLEHPLPISFPFHASIKYPPMYARHPPAISYFVHFVTVKIVIDYTPFTLTLGKLYFYYSFFLLFNLVGAILGYWISKTTFIDKLLKKGQNISP
jgi:hypothetical protein